MISSTTIMLLIYCMAIALVSLAGGLLPNWVRMTHTRTQLVMSFVSGLMLGVAFYNLLPHSVAVAGAEHGVEFSVWWLMLGLITMFLLLRLLHFHQHDFSAADDPPHADAHGHAHNHSMGLTHGAAHRLSWLGIALGLALHTLIDGVALGAVMQGGLEVQAGGVAGLAVFLAIFLHKPLDAMSITTTMAAGGWDRSARAATNALFALMCPLGALLFFFGVNVVVDARHLVLAAALAFSAGVFVCIALSDLLPEVQFHSHDRGKLTVAFLLGIALAYTIGNIEPAGLHPVIH